MTRHVMTLAIAWGLMIAAPMGASADDQNAMPSVSAKDWQQISPGLRMMGQIRFRTENQEDFAWGTTGSFDDQSHYLSRVRLGLNWTPSEWMSFVVEGQDAAIYRNDTIDEDLAPSTVADAFDLHQLYGEFKWDMGGMPVSMRLGRQRLSLGNQRLIGEDDWANTARSMDGVRFTFGSENQRTYDLFAMLPHAVRPHNFNDREPIGLPYLDGELYGFWMTDWTSIRNTKWSTYFLVRHENEFDDETKTLGFNTHTTWGAWDLGSEFAYQWGDFLDMDHDAWMYHLGFGYTFKGNGNPRVGLAYTYASGDDDATDMDHDTFDPLYPSNHLYYGEMDFFALANMNTVEASFQTGLMDKGKLKIAWHYFWLDEEENDAFYGASLGVNRVGGVGVNEDDEVGHEVDVTFTYPLWNDQLHARITYAHFFSGDFLDDTGSASDADYFTVQAIWKF